MPRLLCIQAHLYGHTHEVLFVGRQRVQGIIEKAGALNVVPAGKPAVSIPATDVAFVTDVIKLVDFDPDYVLVTLKGTQVGEAFRQLDGRRFSEKTVFVSLQNGARNPDQIRTFVPDNRVLGGMVPFNVAISSPEDGSRFYQGTGGDIMIEASEVTEPIAQALREAGVPLRVTDNIKGVLYAKLATNLNNAVNALSGVNLLAEFSQYSFRYIWSRCISEALTIYAAHNIKAVSPFPIPLEAFSYMLAFPDFVCNFLFRNIFKVKAEARSSMGDDFMNRRATEIGDLNGEIVRLAEEIGRGDDVRYCRGVLWLVVEAERRQKEEWGGPEWRPSLTGEQIMAYVEKGIKEDYPF
ncbi:hypothetical protein BC937DRAFT_89225 [Endogone sp. FLAS-F59071]|nr:hypothetical protein BC937DRAFT_89225 [Endogone sp. FLAS-F59071]|eukprot:RUS22434.1 hypothetical protein BC937DRAFT_89225 [Endogone sp. FLAS-F59071]